MFLFFLKLGKLSVIISFTRFGVSFVRILVCFLPQGCIHCRVFRCLNVSCCSPWIAAVLDQFFSVWSVEVQRSPCPCIQKCCKSLSRSVSRIVLAGQESKQTAEYCAGGRKGGDPSNALAQSQNFQTQLPLKSTHDGIGFSPEGGATRPLCTPQPELCFNLHRSSD